MANFKIDRFKYTWKGLWLSATEYIRDDVVGFSGNTYVCIKQHTADGDFYNDLDNQDTLNQIPDPYWVKMTEGVVWLGDWQTATFYNVGDIVAYKNSIYIAVTNHTSTSDLESDIVNWTLYSQQIKFLAEWSDAVGEYLVNDVVVYNGKAYICIEDHSPTSDFDDNEEKWLIYHSQIIYKNAWQPTTEYLLDNVVTYQGKVYVCIQRHVSSTEFEDVIDSSEKWQIYYENIRFASEWQSSTKYTADSVVIYKSKVYLATQTHTSSTDFLDDRETLWEIYNEQILWTTDWEPGEEYDINYIAKYNGIVYRCIELHLSTTLFEENQDKWEVYNRQIEFRSTWLPSTRYAVEDIVVLGGAVYRCIEAHTSTTDFNDNLSDWTEYAQQVSFKQDWQAETYYVLEDVVRYGGVVYRCVGIHTSTINFEDNLADWQIYGQQLRFRNEWQAEVKYVIGDVIVYGGIVYECLETHVSAIELLGLEDDQSKWKIYYENIQYRSDYSADIRYVKNDLVTFSGSLFRCIEGHQSTVELQDDKWVVELPGSRYRENWSDSVYYGVGSVVRHGGYLYYAISNNINSNPSNAIYGGEDSTVKWAVLSKGIRFLGNWKDNESYLTGDVVILGGNLYVCLVDTVSELSDFLDETIWELLVVGIGWRGTWRREEIYGLGDLVKFSGDTYTCSFKHVSSDENKPVPGEDSQFWTLTIQGGPNTVTKTLGDLITFGDLEDSGQGAKRLPVGENGQVLGVDEDGLVYKTWGENQRVRYVSSDGVDDPLDPIRGTTITHPWKTIRFACWQLDDDFQGETTINVSTGRFEEILPIVVPERTAIVGAELRSTTIVAKSAMTELAEDSEYSLEALTRISEILTAVLSNQLVEKSPNNLVDQVTLDINLDAFVVSEILNKIANIQQYINFYLGEFDEGVTPTLPQVFGSNVKITNTEVVNTLELLMANRRFLAAEAVAYIQDTYPEYNFDIDRFKLDIYNYIDAWRYDTIYPGNYKSLLAARYYRNSVLGNQEEDMFYLRDATGLRNFTTSGLRGEFTTFDVNTYREVSAGAYASLDPGWGPNYEKVWINTRSPYIQNVTTIGTKCIGQKIDGALHNGGNRSMVSNDFTQVLDDGIGAWVANVGRAELVSVFTYYCDTGYLTTDGGIIRSTNGNNSYGRLGAVSVGVSAEETPIAATANNRTTQAIVASAQSGDFQDEIQILEWVNAGQFYSQAFAEFRGAGVGAEVEFEDFRDDAVFETKLVDLSDDPVRQDIGGTGYVFSRNNAQVHQTPNGDLTSITIAVTDQNQEENYLGMRIIISSGAGTGQYGYITGYNTTTKVVTVARESDNEPGWDHLVPGTDLANPLDNSTVYNIEPRVVYDDPGFDIEPITLPLGLEWAAAVYGETTEFYTNIAVEEFGNFGGQAPEISFAQATFDIVKQGRSYSITLNDGGVGYGVGDNLTILGFNIGGTSPENDISITVLSVSNDSSQSVITFEFSVDRDAPSGRFLITAENSSQYVYSSNGQNWTSGSLPETGNWTNLAAGDNQFVAILSGSGTNTAAQSFNGISWNTTSLPGDSGSDWSAVTFGSDKFVAISRTQNNAAYSTDGVSWTLSTLPDGGTAIIREWIAITYGKRNFVAIAQDENVVAVSSDGDSWTEYEIDVQGINVPETWVSIAYGNNRYVAISESGTVVFSFDGETWKLSNSLPLQDGSTQLTWNTIKYAQGVFFVISNQGSNGSNFAVTSPDGIAWTERELTATASWTAIAFGNPYIFEFDSSVGKNTPRWITAASSQTTINVIRTGARAMGRVSTSAGIIREIRLWDPGSGYLKPPTTTLVSPDSTSDAEFNNRMSDGVLSNPSWINRGSGYRTATTRVQITGNGFADIIPIGRFIRITGLANPPIPGTQVLFNGIDRIYSIVTVEKLSNNSSSNSINDTYEIRLTPELRLRDDIQHGSQVLLRRDFSQCRITGHDYLDIGTGNFLQTNYPELYKTGLVNNSPENETKELDGGQVFFTATDQSGNFKTGELFEVEQATGIVTLSADFFDLAGLDELKLGGIRVGGSGAVIREFSTDPLLTQDSNNVLSTQRAIARFLNSRLTVGGSEVAVPVLVAGQIVIGPDEFNNTLGLTNIITVPANFSGTGRVRGTILAQTMFHASFFDPDV